MPVIDIIWPTLARTIFWSTWQGFFANELIIKPFKGDELILRPFKGDKLMRDEYCDGNHYGDPTSLITSATRKNYFENN